MVEQNAGLTGTSSPGANPDDRQEADASQLFHDTSDNDDASSPEGDPLSPRIESAFDTKAVQKLFGMSQFNPLNLNNSFASLLQQSHFMNMSNVFNLVTSSSNPSSSRQTPERNDDDLDLENLNNGEPEDLSLSRLGHPSKGSDNDETGSVANSSYTFEEQFKQLYEVNDDPNRKAWLDDWLSFMNKIGKPVTRIPIMAKQTLDLYELYQLVVKHGGLVEVINKKLWREITKGLNLPPSITSAAFTLRSQYHKYLYEYECDKNALSNVDDLNAAIEANRREGRRNPGPLLNPPSSAGLNSGLMMNGSGHGAFSNWPMPFFNRFGSHFGIRNDEENPLAALTNNQQVLAAAAVSAERQLEMLQRAASEAANMRLQQSRQQHNQSGRSSASSMDSAKDGAGPSKSGLKRSARDANFFDPASGSGAGHGKRPHRSASPGRSTNMKILTKDNQMFVSMEVNGTVYQGVLEAAGLDPSSSHAKPHEVSHAELVNDGMNALSALLGAELNSSSD